MKRFLQGALILIAVVELGTSRLFAPAAQFLAPTQAEGGEEEIAGSADLASLALAAVTLGRLKIAPSQPSKQSMISSASRLDREKVEVLARSVTFPGVLKQGELLINIDFPTATILCFEVGFYAGQAGSLIWAMDRDTVIEHRLYWIIDAADDLFYGCEAYLFLEAAADHPESDRNQLMELKEILVEQIQMIQIALRFAENVKIKAREGRLG